MLQVLPDLPDLRPQFLVPTTRPRRLIATLVILETLLGKDDADLIATVDGLAYACFGQKKYDEAEPIYQQAALTPVM